MINIKFNINSTFNNRIISITTINIFRSICLPYTTTSSTIIIPSYYCITIFTNTRRFNTTFLINIIQTNISNIISTIINLISITLLKYNSVQIKFLITIFIITSTIHYSSSNITILNFIILISNLNFIFINLIPLILSNITSTTTTSKFIITTKRTFTNILITITINIRFKIMVRFFYIIIFIFNCNSIIFHRKFWTNKRSRTSTIRIRTNNRTLFCRHTSFIIINCLII